MEGHANADKQKVEKKKKEKCFGKTMKTKPLALDILKIALFCECEKHKYEKKKKKKEH